MLVINKVRLLVVPVSVFFSSIAVADIITDIPGYPTGGETTQYANQQVLVVDDTGAGGGGSTNQIIMDAGFGTVTVTDGTNEVVLGTNGSVQANQLTIGGTTLTGGNLNGISTINGTAVSSFATTTQINALDRRIDSVSEKAYSGIASVAALAAIPGPAEGKRFSVGVGVGHYEGESAFAVGANASVTPNLNVKVGVGHSSGNTTANAGASFSW